jgi:hypothetical protein
VHRESIEASRELKPRSKYYYALLLDFMVKSWPGIGDRDIRGITEADCNGWLLRSLERLADELASDLESCEVRADGRYRTRFWTRVDSHSDFAFFVFTSDDEGYKQGIQSQLAARP